MSKNLRIAIGLLGLSVLLLPARRLLGIEIAPATARDIKYALGPDASGLRLSQESLPDLFALTASRIEESPKQFTVEQPYTSGRWKGGKAVIEYARDLSYTLVSVYDKDGHRQRIYSVRTAFSSHAAPQEAKATPTEQEPAETSPANDENTAWEKPAARTTRTQPVSSGEAPSVGYEWDEAKGAYVALAGNTAVATETEEKQTSTASAARTTERRESVGTPASTSSTSTTHRRRRHHAEETFTPPPLAKTSGPAPMADSGVWLPSASKAGKASTSSTPREVVKAGNTTWVEHRDENAPPPSFTHRRRHKKAETETVVAQAPAQETTKANEEWVPKSVEETPTSSKRSTPSKRPVENEVPSTEELLANEAPPPPPSRTSSHRHHRAAASEAPAPAPVIAQAPPPPVRSVPQETMQVASRNTAPARNVPEEAPPVAVSAPEPAQLPPVHYEEPPKSSRSAAPVPSAEDLLASSGNGKAGPDTGESDKWTPKSVPKVAPEPAQLPPIEEPVKVAMVPKKAVDNSVENLLKMANEGKEKMPEESEKWVPKKSATTSPEVDISKEISRVQAEERKAAAVSKPKPVARRDVNNPEEGVLPVSSFEKFSGPMYGRHREYERRFYPGKKAKSGGAPAHDFYVDEVDRKKEIHNIYYYLHEKGKAPRLVAVERHDKVSFMGNYDIDREDKGKVSTYN